MHCACFTTRNNSPPLQLEDAVRSMRHRLTSEAELSARTQRELEGDLKGAKRALLEVQAELRMAEKVISSDHNDGDQDCDCRDLPPPLPLLPQELEKKFSETGAYKNLKKMLSSKNEQIRELRTKVKKYEEEERGGAGEE